MAVQPLDVTVEAAQSELDSLASIASSLHTRAPFMISQEEVRLYHERGYAKVEGVLTDAELDALRRVCDAYLEDYCTFSEHLRPPSSCGTHAEVQARCRARPHRPLDGLQWIVQAQAQGGEH